MNTELQSSRTLFRREVFNAQRGDWLGTIRLATPVGFWALTGLALLIVLVLVAFLLSGHYTRRERAAGTLVPAAGLIELKSTGTGIVTLTPITQGADVHQGDLLVALSSERVTESIGGTSEAVSEQLKLQRAAVEADLKDQDKLARQRRTVLQNQISILNSELLQLKDQILLQDRQAKNASALLEKVQPLLDKGYLSAVQMRQYESAALDAEAQGKAITRQLLEAQQQLAVLEDQMQQLPITARTQRHELERRHAEIEQSLAENEARRSSALRAPADGILASLLIQPGQAVIPGQTLLTIVPRGSLLQAELLVPTRAIGFVARGTPVVLRYQAFPYQKFGLHVGRVKTIADSAMTAADASTFLGQQISEAMYRVDVELDTQTIQAYGRREVLRPGMAMDAELMIDRRSLIEWIFEPLYGMEKRIAVGPIN